MGKYKLIGILCASAAIVLVLSCLFNCLVLIEAITAASTCVLAYVGYKGLGTWKQSLLANSVNKTIECYDLLVVDTDSFFRKIEWLHANLSPQDSNNGSATYNTIKALIKNTNGMRLTYSKIKSLLEKINCISERKLTLKYNFEFINEAIAKTDELNNCLDQKGINNDTKNIIEELYKNLDYYKVSRAEDKKQLSDFTKGFYEVVGK